MDWDVNGDWEWGMGLSRGDGGWEHWDGWCSGEGIGGGTREMGSFSFYQAETMMETKGGESE